MQKGQGAGQRIDVLIVTAVPEEYAAVLAVGTGAVEGSVWDGRKASTGLAISVRPFVAASGGLLWVGVTQALGMGGVEAGDAAGQLLKEYRARCLAMCGVCAGRRGKVALGDVIVADRMWTYDTGKVEVEVDKGGQRTEHESGDIEMSWLAPLAWKQDAERFEVDPKAAWLAKRPRSYETQGDWVLERVLRGSDPVADAESTTKCADLDKVLARLWKKKLLRDGKVVLTAAGKSHIARVLLLNRGRLPEPAAFRTHVGPIASGSRVVEDAGIFEKLSTPMRKVIGLEMEAAAIGGLAHKRRLEYAVVMKGVMDHADPDKSDNFKEFAARASAECLIAFVRAHLPVGGDREDEILVPGTSPLPERHGPAALLNARHEVVGFVGREKLLEDLQRWCEREGRVTARLIHAAGGMGKTRLVIEMCKRMRAAGWRAGFVPKELGVDRFAALVESDQPVLAAIDYAESRGKLSEILEAAAARRGEQGKRRLRLILLARNADDWWTDLLRSAGPVTDLLSEDEPIGLQALAGLGADRAEIFREAVKAFAGADHKKVPEGAVPNLEDRRYERALYVHMAALAVIGGREVKTDELMVATLDHEERFWREQLRERVAIEDMRQVVAALTLTSGVGSAAEARAVVEHICGAPDKKMVLLLRDLYPGTGEQHLAGLEPDLLGEAMVLRALSKEGEGAGPYLDRVFKGADGEAIRTGFTVLGRLSEDHKKAEGWIAHVLGRDVTGRAMAAFAAARSVGERTAHAGLGLVLAKALEREGTVELATRLERDLPHAEQTVSLREVGRWALATQLEHLPEGTGEERARVLNNLSGWQSALGQRETALASILKAVDLYRPLAEARPDSFLPVLATSLNNLGVKQGELGQREAALASTMEAVAIRRRLVEARPDAFLPNLAMSLSNLGIRQSELGQREAALASTMEAVDLYRPLAEARPDAFQPNLATSLNNLGRDQSALGQRDAALASALEAVAIRRRLAEAQPDAFLPVLASSLNNLGIWRSALGELEAALASTLEAVAIYRRLAEARPDSFLPDLARSLSNLGMWQSALGELEAALASTLESVAIRRRLAEARPDAFLPALADSLHNLGSRQSALGELEAALASTLEAVAIYRPLAEARPDAFQPNLATSLNNLGMWQNALGELEAALASTMEAVDLYRPLAEARPDAFLPDLATSLHNLSVDQNAHGQPEPALASAREALDAYWRFFLAHPAAFAPNTTLFLNNLLVLHESLGRPPSPELLQRKAALDAHLGR